MSKFQEHRKLTLFLVSTCCVFLLLVASECSLRIFVGLGTPVLYQSSPLFGYRLQPNQLVHRRGAEIRVNNLGLRADRDWDGSIDKKILFLGNSVTFGGTYISNEELFSHRAVEGLEGYVGGNAGVNGWGVENISALIVDYEFLPARTYVTVLQEMDFYRGLSKLAGKPFWTTKPTFALQEMLGSFHLDRLSNMYEGHDRFVTVVENEKTVERACARLRAMDEYLKSRGCFHRIYLSTNRSQLFEGSPPDPLVEKYLARYEIIPTYIKDQPEIGTLSVSEQKELFYDWNHLSVKGHQVWARIINRDLRVFFANRSRQS